MGDFPGHPFRGNQHTEDGGGVTVQRGDYRERLAQREPLTPAQMRAAQTRQRKFDEAMRRPGSYDHEAAMRQLREDEYQARETERKAQAKLEREAKKAAQPVRDKTCQICGRDIMANTGTIAHHGYERPGWGYQTSSCPGAKCVPYEEGHDALDRAIERTAEQLKEAEKAAAEIAVTHPERITHNVPDYNAKRIGGRVAMKEVHYDRPADFDPKNDYSEEAFWRTVKDTDPYEMNQARLAAVKPHMAYAKALAGIRGERKQIVQQIKETHKYLSQRRAAWKKK